MVVLRPVGDRTQCGAGRENVRRLEHRHESHEAAVRAAVDPHPAPVAAMLAHQPLHPIRQVLELGGSHPAVDRGAPVAAVAL